MHCNPQNKMSCNLRSGHVTSLLHSLTRLPSKHDQPEQERPEDRPLYLVPRGGLCDPVEASRLWLLSPLVRAVMASVASEDAVILLPDFEKDDVTRGLALLRYSGEDTMVFTAGVKSFLEAVGMDVSRSEVWVKQEPLEREENVEEEKNDSEDTSTGTDGNSTGDNDYIPESVTDEKQENIEEESDEDGSDEEQASEEEAEESLKEKSHDNVDVSIGIGNTTYNPESSDDQEEDEVLENIDTIDEKNFAKKAVKTSSLGHSLSVSCPFCSRDFFGSTSKLKDKLKCHLGYKHFVEELDEEAKIFFDEDNKCKENGCGKIYKNKFAKRKHLTFNHSKLVVKILDIAKEEVSKAKKVSHLESNDDTEALLQSDEDYSNHSADTKAPEPDSKQEQHMTNYGSAAEEIETDLEDVHKLLMDENSDSDSDEEEDHDTDRADPDVQNLLFQDQDFSDDDDDEEEDDESQKILPPQNETSLMEKVSAFFSSVQKQNEKIQGSMPQQKDRRTLEKVSEFHSSLHKRNNELFSNIRTEATKALHKEIDDKVRGMIISDGKNSKCKVCERTGVHSSIFRHAEIHLKGYKHPCNNCSLISKTRMSLVEHMRKCKARKA